MLECEEFSKKGSCQEGDKCKMYHRRRNHKRRRSSSVSGTKVPRPFTKKVKLRRNSDEMLNIKGKYYTYLESFLGGGGGDV